MDVAVDLVQAPPPAAVPSTTPPGAASAERSLEQRVRSAAHAPTSAAPGPSAPSDAPHSGLRTIANGTGAWPEQIPHHLGRITGSRHGGVAVWGALSEAGLRRAVTRHSSGIRRCYDEGLLSMPDLAGQAILRLVIQRDGHVQRVNTLGSDLASRAVLRCLESLFQNIRFPRPDADTVMVTYPLPFSPPPLADWGQVP
ncbi:MAG TPA: AgmX/PglI C-terminal domain-containing protein [Polyangiaceae bacterium]|nr:AgmX/PglI C-terminal domain-containing protein [Polyangiaceae bacterium]